MPSVTQSLSQKCSPLWVTFWWQMVCVYHHLLQKKTSVHLKWTVHFKEHPCKLLQRGRNHQKLFRAGCVHRGQKWPVKSRETENKCISLNEGHERKEGASFSFVYHGLALFFLLLQTVETMCGSEGGEHDKWFEKGLVCLVAGCYANLLVEIKIGWTYSTCAEFPHKWSKSTDE